MNKPTSLLPARHALRGFNGLLSMLLVLAGLSACEGLRPPRDGGPGIVIVDAGGRSIGALQTGSSLHVGANSLRPRTTYEFRVGLDRQADSLESATSFARSRTDRNGNIPAFVLWYQSGVVGCHEDAAGVRHPSYRSFDEAERALAGRTLMLSVHEVQHDPGSNIAPMKLRVEKAALTVRLPVVARTSPMVFASNAQGCLLNSQENTSADMFVSGRNFGPGESLEVAVVPNQRGWSVGDAINDMTGVGGAAAVKKVTADAQGRFTLKAWDRPNQRRGTYDIVAHRPHAGDELGRRINADDIVSYGSETGFLLFLRYPVGGPTMDIAGRPLTGSPYFQFADSFAETSDAVWGAVDPTYVPVGHPGGTYAAYYVVNHRSVAGWDPTSGGSTALTDVSGGIEIHPVKAGCINGTDVIIWNPPLTLGEYDVVVDFGSTAATTPAAYATDGQYNDSIDFLDGADQVGFVVARDPYELGPLPIGSDSYSQDDFFATLGSRSGVDLRAVIRYPATSAGAGAPVAAGTHPVFVIEHGNHRSCNVGGFDGNPSYDVLHTGCPNRTRNHEGYLRLLDILASHGIIAVSIDAYDLTGYVPQLNAERSDLILKHLELWSHLNDSSTFTAYPNFFSGRFAGHVDMSKIQVSGHSRGGEASVGAFKRNTVFNINSVSSIAPVDSLGQVLPDVPYFVMLPAGDGDVIDLGGLRIYDRAGSALTPVDATTKSGIDVYGASHNFFNTVWATDGDDGVAGRDNFIPAADQQRLGEAFLAAFARIHLKNETVYEDMLRGKLVFPSFSGRPVYAFRHEKSHSKFESGSAAGTPSAGASVASVLNPSLHTTRAVRIGWSGSSETLTYSLPLAQRDVTPYEVLSLRVAQTNSSTNLAANQDFQVELVGGGMTKATYTSRFRGIPKPYRHQYVDWSGSTVTVFDNVMSTIRIPLHSFIMNKSGVTLNNVDTVRLRFSGPTQGEVYVDDIEFSR
jgi:hypothetical protein